MTIDELRDLRYLSMEIELQDRQIEELRHPKHHMTAAQWGEYVDAARPLIELSLEQKEACERQIEGIQRFLDSIEDPLIRDLLYKHYGEGWTWNELSDWAYDRHGLQYEPDSLKKMCYRYMEKRNDKTA